MEDSELVVKVESVRGKGLKVEMSVDDTTDSLRLKRMVKGSSGVKAFFGLSDKPQKNRVGAK